MAKKPIEDKGPTGPTGDMGVSCPGAVGAIKAPDPADGFPSAELLAEIRAQTRDFAAFEAKHPSIAAAGRHIGPALGLGPINTAEAILLWQHWIGAQ